MLKWFGLELAVQDGYSSAISKNNYKLILN